MVNIYGNESVFDKAFERIRHVYSEFSKVIVMMSGGKDSAVLFEIASVVCKELGRKVDVVWLDQEAEWQGTVDYMRAIFNRSNVNPHWCQFPFNLGSSMELGVPFFRVFDEDKTDVHIHAVEENSIKENPTNKNRFTDILQDLPKTIMGTTDVAVLSGMRASESPIRRVRTMFSRNPYKNISWSSTSKHRVLFYPLYDWIDSDVWTALGTQQWDYNVVYDKMYHAGYSRHAMRISALIHETAWANIYSLQEIEPETYNRFLNRIPGVLTYCHVSEETMRVRKLPDLFLTWKEYRDYLLDALVKDDELKKMFVRRWEGQDEETFHKLHVRELVCGDYEGTKNSNYSDGEKLKDVKRTRIE